MPILTLENSNLKEINEVFRLKNLMVLIPIGSIEQHGHHLPYGTDSMIADLICGEIQKRYENKLNLIITPTIKYGCSPEHMDFPGTISLKPETIIMMLRDVCRSLVRHGVKKIVILNTHGGNTGILSGLLHQLRRDYNVNVFLINTWSILSKVMEDIRESEEGGVVHAGEAETSIMLYLRESLVGTRENVVIPWIDRNLKYLKVEKPVYVLYSWFTRDFSEYGFIGDPLKASREKGRKIFNAIVEEVCKVLDEIARF